MKECPEQKEGGELEVVFEILWVWSLDKVMQPGDKMNDNCSHLDI